MTLTAPLLRRAQQQILTPCRHPIEIRLVRETKILTTVGRQFNTDKSYHNNATRLTEESYNNRATRLSKIPKRSNHWYLMNPSSGKLKQFQNDITKRPITSQPRKNNTVINKTLKGAK